MSESIPKMIERIYPIEAFENRQKLLQTGNPNLTYLKNAFELDCRRKLDQDAFCSGPLVSEIFQLIFGSALLNVDIDSGAKNLVADYMNNIASSSGGAFPTLPRMDWQRKSRIYSTFYFLALLNLLDPHEYFLRKNKEWSRKTSLWLFSLQEESGLNRGAFREEDCPMSITPENTFWAVWSLSYLGKSEFEGELNVKIKEALSWVSDNYLHNKRGWSVTKLFYAVDTLHFFGGLPNLSNEMANDVQAFIKSMNTLEGYHEYPSSVKEGYREEVTRHHSCLHSGLYANLLLKMIGNHSFTTNDLTILVDRFLTKEGYGTKVKIKEYDYGPISTVFENMLTTVTFLSACL